MRFGGCSPATCKDRCIVRAQDEYLPHPASLFKPFLPSMSSLPPSFQHIHPIEEDLLKVAMGASPIPREWFPEFPGLLTGGSAFRLDLASPASTDPTLGGQRPRPRLLFPPARRITFGPRAGAGGSWPGESGGRSFFRCKKAQLGV